MGSAKQPPEDGGAACFVPRNSQKALAQITMATTATSPNDSQQEQPSVDFCQGVSTLASDPAFTEKHTSKSAPSAMMAFADMAADRMINKKKTLDHFDGLVMEVPSHGEEDINNQQCHLIVGQKLLCVD